METIFTLTNLYKKPLDEDVIGFFKKFKKEFEGKNVLKELDEYIKEQGVSLDEIVQSHLKRQEYESKAV